MLTQKSLLLVVFVLLVLSSPCSPTLLKQLQAINFPHTSWDRVHPLLSTGEMNGFFMWREVLPVFDWLGSKFPNLVSKPFNIGKTHQKNDIVAYAITAASNEDDFKSRSKPAVLFTGQHHAREVIALNMQVYLTLQFLHQYIYVRDPETQRRINETVTWFIPIVNMDSVLLINKHFEETQMIMQIRKNQHIYSEECSGIIDYGVDLNRNYDFAFGYDNEGSSGDECSDQYRGPGPFSEPETRAVRDFVLAHPNIVLAVNLHAYGNLWIIPYNYLRDASNTKLSANSSAYQIYSEIEQECLTTKTAVTGNAQKTVEYPANGEASDWLLGDRNIITLSPEIGNDLPSAQSFFPRQSDIVQILQDTAATLDNIIEKVVSDVQTNYIREINQESMKKRLFKESETLVTSQEVHVVQLFNKGLSPSSELTFEVNATGSVELFYAIFNESFFLNSVNQTGVDYHKYPNYTVFPERIINATKTSTSSAKTTVTFEDRITIPARSFMQIYLTQSSSDSLPINLVLKGLENFSSTIRIGQKRAISLAERLKIEVNNGSLLIIALLTALGLAVLTAITLRVWTKWSSEGVDLTEDEMDLCRSREMEERAGDLVLNSL